MIVTKTPLRISFFGGGSDIPQFYDEHEGMVLSTTINSYIYLAVNKCVANHLKVIYSELEHTDDVEKIKHDRVRECLKHYELPSNIEICSFSDVPVRGTGLGSSSTFTVGLINALHRIKTGKNIDVNELAELASYIEIIKCNEPIGKQDQYAAAYGGMNIFTFEKDGNVETRPLTYNEACWNDLESRLLLVYSGRGRNANSILQKQAAAMSDEVKFDLVRRSRDKAYVAARYLKENRLDDFGSLLHDAWLDKKAVETSITNEYFDGVYERAREAGALGGKLLGAGGGGFFIFYVDPSKREQVVKTITDGTECKVYDFSFTEYGSRLTGYA